MTEAVTPVEADAPASEAQALADAQAGYERKTRGEQPPVSAEPTTESTPAPVEETPTAEATQGAPTPEGEPAQPMSVADELAALRARVNEMASTSADPGEIRRLNGEIGNINRTLQQLQKGKEEGEQPAASELDAVLKDAEAVAEEYPELAGPLVKAIKALQSIAPKAPEVDIDARVSAAVAKQREQDAIAALKEEHPDFTEFRQTADFKDWLASKPAAFRKTFTETWNPATVAKGLTEAKEWAKARRQNKDRRLSAVLPQGAGGPQVKQPPSDEQAVLAGYNRAKGRRI